MFLRTLKIITLFFSIILIALLVSFSLVKAQLNSDFEKTCQDLVDKGQQNISKNEYQSLLKKCQSFYEEQVKKLEKEVEETGSKKNTLKAEIDSLNKKIKNLDYQIYQSSLVIKDLEGKIVDTTDSIQKISQKIEKSREKLSNILRVINEEDQKSAIEILFGEESISSFVENLVALERLSNESKRLLRDIKDLKVSLIQQKESLDEEKKDLEKTLQIQKIQKVQNYEAKKEQEKYLSITEQEYQRKLQEKKEAEEIAAKIRAKIYELIGVRKDVTYNEALKVAEYAAGQAGIRPALLLGILSQESAIGRNVGQCYLKNPKTGSGVVAYNGKFVSRVMKPTRDVSPFLKIIEDINKQKGLNLDPYKTLVSCPMSIGWGGAMGPAQFIPSTWILFKNKIESVTGISADPWDIRDASLGAAFYLKKEIDRYGGSEGKAVQSYFCGSAKNTYWCRWYEKNVLYLAKCHQTFIDKGSMSLECQKAIGLK